MGITVDPDVFIKDWLEEKWDGPSVGFIPTFTTTPYKAGVSLPRITVKELSSPPQHLNLGSTYHMYNNIYAINIWDTQKDKVWDMRQEVRRIVYNYQKNPTTATYPTPGIEHILIYEEFPQDNFAVRPPILSRSIRVYLLHLETNP